MDGIENVETVLETLAPRGAVVQGKQRQGEEAEGLNVLKQPAGDTEDEKPHRKGQELPATSRKAAQEGRGFPLLVVGQYRPNRNQNPPQAIVYVKNMSDNVAHAQYRGQKEKAPQNSHSPPPLSQCLFAGLHLVDEQDRHAEIDQNTAVGLSRDDIGDRLAKNGQSKDQQEPLELIPRIAAALGQKIGENGIGKPSDDPQNLDLG